MKTSGAFFLLIFVCMRCLSQNDDTEYLVKLLAVTKEDTARVNILNKLASGFINSSPEKAIAFATQANELADKAAYTYGLAYSLKNLGLVNYVQGNYVQAMIYWNQSLSDFEKINDKKGIANILNNQGAVYFNRGDDPKALEYYLKALKFSEEIHDTVRLVSVLNNIGAIYDHNISTHDKSIEYYLKALPLSESLGDMESIGTVNSNLGELYFKKGKDSLALKYFEKSVQAYGNSPSGAYVLNSIAKVHFKRREYSAALAYHQQAWESAMKLSARLEMTQSLCGLAAIYLKQKDLSKAIKTYQRAETLAKESGINHLLEEIYSGMSEAYVIRNDFEKALKYESLLMTVRDTLYNSGTEKKLAFLQFNFDIQKKQDEIDLLTAEKSLKELALKKQETVRNSLITILALVLLVAFILFRIYRVKAKANLQLNAKRNELEQTLSDLKTTQKKLIHAEKMASFGEITSGIAHEIQNPLNFVNNFSEINKELIDELSQELILGNQQVAIAIAADIKVNELKINLHGKKADSIVKGMIQHTNKISGEKELTDIKGLAKECLRLGYQVFRTRNNDFNAVLKTDFDPLPEKISVIPQDLSRVLLNLYNNAFYAVKEKQKAETENGRDAMHGVSLAEGYEPQITVITKKKGNNVEITVKDNGNGIPEKIVDKIFQPFFTTKPTGEGTGLGLSLSYDIIKAHGGEISVKSKSGEGSEFTITLPADA